MFLGVPPAEVDITVDLVRELVDTQFPQFKKLELSFLDSGWDNENYRLGNDLIVRMPRRLASVELLENEIEWLPKLKIGLPLSIPAYVEVGKPNDDYPWSWTIIPWYDGRNGCNNQPNNVQVLLLVDFLKKLHKFPADAAPYNDHRCLPLSDKSAEVLERINVLKGINVIVDDRLIELWQQSIAEPISDQKYLIHGDMHPRNIIIDHGEIKSIIDWGDITAGDVAPDLASIWMLFDDAQVRESGFRHYRADASLVLRAKGWAIFFGTLFLELGQSVHEEYRIAGERIIKNVLQ